MTRSGDAYVRGVRDGRTVLFFGELDYEIDGLRYHLSTQAGMTY